MRTAYSKCLLSAVAVLLLLGAQDVQAQFTGKWMDIGDFQNFWVQSSAQPESGTAPKGMEMPGWGRAETSLNSSALYVGVRNWTSPDGQNFDYFVSRVGPRTAGLEFISPVDSRLIARFEDTAVNVNGVSSFSKIAVVDEVDPSLPADRVVQNVYNLNIGLTGEETIWAYSNEHHDNYMIVRYRYTNTGNNDIDEEIELDGQTLEDVYFYRNTRWRGDQQAAWLLDAGQAWGKFNMIDVVGDGHDDYVVDFTAQYVWTGWASTFTQYNNLGGSLWDDAGSGQASVVEGDSIGRLTDNHFMGKAVLHADSGPNDNTYRPEVQPNTISYLDQDDPLTAAGLSHRDYYELAILGGQHPHTRDNGVPVARSWPHYADIVEESGEFWNPTNDAASGRQGGFGPTMAYGPYQLEFGETVEIIEVVSMAGLSFDASVQIGRAYKASGGDDSRLIGYDANGDGQIEDKEFTVDTYNNNLYWGDEMMTKNQWVMTARDSLFKAFERAFAVWDAGNGMAQYPIVEPPRPPVQFDVFGLPDRIELTWTPLDGGPPRSGWEVYRTSRFSDNYLTPWYQDNCLQPGVFNSPPECREHNYELVAELPPNATSWDDTGAVRGEDYYYYLVAVGEDQPVDPMGITGTPNGEPLRSSRYYTQTWQAASLKRPPYDPSRPESERSVEDARVVPNPVNLAADQSIRFAREDQVGFFNIPGEATITIYTELGEFVHQIEHTDGSGDETWNLTTEAQQLLSSGIYIAVIEDNVKGGKVIRKFTVIR